MNDLLERRKIEHIQICADQDVEASDRYTGLSEVSFMPRALPELDWDELDTSTTFLSGSFSAPFLITGMTGGVEQGEIINARLAKAASQFGIPMGVGSQRVALEADRHKGIFNVKAQCPKLWLIGNIGIGQLTGSDYLDLCLRAVEMIDADALAIHVNVLQEVMQPEGDRRFNGVLERLAAIAANLGKPLIVKEVGCGMDLSSARSLAETGVSAIDIGGSGGTSWGFIEGLRAPEPMRLNLARQFRNWGLPTAHSLALVRNGLPKLPLVATGGIRSGLDAAKALGLGASMVGIGLPLFRAALKSEAAVTEVLEELLQGLKIAMLCTGSQTCSSLEKALVHGRPGAKEFSELMTERSRQGVPQTSEDSTQR